MCDLSSKSDRENIIQLSNKLMLLSNKLQEILDISSDTGYS